MKTGTDINASVPADCTTDQQADQRPNEEESWRDLHQRILTLAHRRSKMLVGAYGDDDESFDKGARALRTLMSAAEVAGRMQREEAKDQERHDEGASESAITTEAIEAEYRKICNTISALDDGAGFAENEGSAEKSGGDIVANGAGPRGETLEDQRP